MVGVKNNIEQVIEMDEAPEDRRKRLKAMRASAGKQPTSDSTAASTGVKDGSGSKKLKFRNYQPYDESLLRQNSGWCGGPRQRDGQ